MERAEANTFAPLVAHIEDRIDLSSSHVLDLGCGSGGISEAISRKCKRLTAADINPGSVESAVEKSNCPALGIQLDATTLPFSEGSFDLVILNGVLEWVPDAHDGNPREIQLEILRQINRVLKPSGLLYLGIESRFYMKYLAGMTDHSGLRFAAPLPRFLANEYSKQVRGREYRNYLYTVSGYRELLSAGGFTEIEPASALPSYKWPQQIVSFRDFEDVRATINSIDEPKWRKRVRKLLAIHSRIFALFGTELVFTASPRS